MIDISTNIPSSTKRILTNKLRLVRTKHRSIGDLVFNYQNAAKTHEKTTPPDCCCRNLNFPKINGHAICKITDIFHPDFLFLKQNVSNIPMPTELHSLDNRKTMIISLVEGIKKHLTPDPAPSNSAPIKLPDDPSQLLLSLLSSLGTIDSSSSSSTTNFLNLLNGIVHQAYPEKHTTTTINEVKLFRKKYDRLILAPLDKNIGCISVMCPISYHRVLQKTFTDNPAYHTVDMAVLNPDHIHDLWTLWYSQQPYSVTIPIKKKPKNEDPTDLSKPLPLIPKAYALL